MEVKQSDKMPSVPKIRFPSSALPQALQGTTDYEHVTPRIMVQTESSETFDTKRIELSYLQGVWVDPTINPPLKFQVFFDSDAKRWVLAEWVENLKAWRGGYLSKGFTVCEPDNDVPDQSPELPDVPDQSLQLQ